MWLCLTSASISGDPQQAKERRCRGLAPPGTRVAARGTPWHHHWHRHFPDHARIHRHIVQGWNHQSVEVRSDKYLSLMHTHQLRWFLWKRAKTLISIFPVINDHGELLLAYDDEMRGHCDVILYILFYSLIMWCSADKSDLCVRNKRWYHSWHPGCE